MNTLTIFLSAAVIVICASQWTSNMWLAQKIATQAQPLATHTASVNTMSKTLTTDTPVQASIDIDGINQHLEAVIEKQVQQAFSTYAQKVLVQPAPTTATTLKEKTEIADTASYSENLTDRSLEKEDTQQAFWAAMDIVSSATLNANWDESVNNQLVGYRDLLTDKQRNEIVSEYVQAFNEGLVDPGVTPPF